MAAMPDLSRYSVLEDDAYEWYLSDHPWAVAERVRRRACWAAKELADAETVRGWADRIHAKDVAGEIDDRPGGWRDELVHLAEQTAAVADEARAARHPRVRRA